MATRKSLPGVYPAVKKDGTPYFRASLTYKSKHISLGSFDTEQSAHEAYLEGTRILKGEERPEIIDYSGSVLGFSKWVALINLRDNGIYCNGPIYLRHKYFEYYLDLDTILRFDASELFYYTNHSIQRRGEHLFVADYGAQMRINSRYGIRNYAVPGKDYYFKNSDRYDFRSGNIVIVNPYYGVRYETYRGKNVYTARVHINGDIVLGHFEEIEDAAIAYNKAADALERGGVRGNFNRNYLENLSQAEYMIRYKSIRFAGSFKKLLADIGIRG